MFSPIWVRKRITIFGLLHMKLYIPSSSTIPFFISIISNVIPNLAFISYFPRNYSRTGNTDPPGINRRYTSGITVGPRNSVLNLKGTTFVLIAHDLVEPLLNPNLLPEDRALDTFQIVSVVLHELTVRDS